MNLKMNDRLNSLIDTLTSIVDILRKSPQKKKYEHHLMWNFQLSKAVEMRKSYNCCSDEAPMLLKGRDLSHRSAWKGDTDERCLVIQQKMLRSPLIQVICPQQPAACSSLCSTGNPALQIFNLRINNLSLYDPESFL